MKGISVKAYRGHCFWYTEAHVSPVKVLLPQRMVCFQLLLQMTKKVAHRSFQAEPKDSLAGIVTAVGQWLLDAPSFSSVSGNFRSSSPV